MISREKAQELLEQYLQNENLKNHSWAVAYIMEELAKRSGEDGDKWFITGLLHDLDYESTKDDPEQHGLKTAKILENEDVSEDMLNAIKAHNCLAERDDLLSKHLWAADPVSGLVVAAALMKPEKKIEALQLKSLKKKYKSKSFAQGANRQQIADCQDFDFELGDFLQLCIDAMSGKGLL